MKSEFPKMVSLREIQKMLPGDMAISTIHRWRVKGLVGQNGQRIRLPMKKVGGKYYVSEAELWSWLQEVAGNEGDVLQESRLTRDELDKQLDTAGIRENMPKIK